MNLKIIGIVAVVAAVAIAWFFLAQQTSSNYPPAKISCRVGTYNATAGKCVTDIRVSVSCSEGTYNPVTGNCETTPSVRNVCKTGTYDPVRNECYYEPPVANRCVSGTYDQMADRCIVEPDTLKVCQTGVYDEATDECVYETPLERVCKSGVYDEDLEKCVVDPVYYCDYGELRWVSGEPVCVPTNTQLYCGDGNCKPQTENCSSCPQDCGLCPIIAINNIGDLNGDGMITNADLQLLRQILDAIQATGVYSGSLNTARADANGDGSLTEDDYLCLSGLIDGTHSSLDQCSDCVPSSVEVCHDGLDNNCDGQTDRETYDNSARTPYATDLCECGRNTSIDMVYDVDGIPGYTNESGIKRCNSINNGPYQWHSYSSWKCDSGKNMSTLQAYWQSYTCSRVNGTWAWRNAQETYPSGVETATAGGSPFGVLPGGAAYSDFSSLIDDIGIKSLRYGGMQGVDYWSIKVPSNIPPGYPSDLRGWGHLDRLYNATYSAGKEMSVIITSDEVPVEVPNGTVLGLSSFPDQGFTPHGTNLTLKQYSDFVKSAVERYPSVTYWEVDNEPDITPNLEPYFLWKGNLSLTGYYAQTVKTAYLAIKSANPNAKVAIGASCTNLDYIEPVLQKLANLSDYPGERFFDVFNFHLYGDYREYGRESFKNTQNPQFPPSINMTRVKALLAKYGYSGIEIIVTEGGTVSGGGAESQTQAQQASNLLKRYVYLTSQGVDRYFWFDLNEDKSREHPNDPIDAYPTNSLVITNNAGVNKKLGYYTYKLMVEKLEGSDWKNVQEIHDSDNVYAFKLIKGGKPIYVLWWDYFDDKTYSKGETKTISLSDLGISGEVKVTETVPKYPTGAEVSDYNSAFNTWTTSGSISLGEIPVYIEGF